MSSTNIAAAAPVRRKRGPDYNKLAPLVYAPLLPLIRIGLKGRLPQQQIDLIFGSTVLLALFHAGYVMSKDSTM